MVISKLSQEMHIWFGLSGKIFYLVINKRKHIMKSLVSKSIMRARVSLFGNNHSILFNINYKIYLRYAQILYKKRQSRTNKDAEHYADLLHRQGYVVLSSNFDIAYARNIKNKIDTLFSDSNNTINVVPGLSRLIDGCENVDEIAEIIFNNVANVVEAYYKSNFKLYTMSIYRTVPCQEAPVSSFLWHFDNCPDESIKLMIYLDDVTSDTGAFRFKTEKLSEEIRKKGFWHRDDFDKVSEILNDESTNITIEGATCTCILFKPGRVVHKATAPIKAHRDVVTTVILPSDIDWRSHYARNRHLLSTNAGLCLNPWNDKPENIGYLY